MSRDEPRPHGATSFRFPFQLSIKFTSLRGEGGGMLDLKYIGLRMAHTP